MSVVEDIYVTKLNANGSFIWARKIGGIAADYGRAIAIDSGANIYICGHFSDVTDFDPGPGVYNLTSPGTGWNVFIAKFDSIGNFVWATSMGGIGDDIGYGVAVNNSAQVFSTGIFEGTANFSSIILASNGLRDIYIASYNSSTTGVSEYTVNKGATVYPNPTTGTVTIDLKEELNSVEVVVSTMLGKKLKEYHIDTTSRLDLEIEGKSGLYFVKVRSKERAMMFKILKY